MNAVVIFIICLGEIFSVIVSSDFIKMSFLKTACSLGANIPPKPCQVETNCGTVNETSSICGLDEEMGCIRKFPSKCHLDIVFCHEGKSKSDY